MLRQLETTQQLQASDLEHIDGLYSYALLLARDPAMAEDLVQETYIRAIKNLHKLGPGSNPKAWLLTVLRNLWFNELRRRRVVTIYADLLERLEEMTPSPSSSKDPYQALAAKDDHRLVRAALDKLSPSLREVVLLREYEELSYHEISIVLRCPEGTVMSRLSRARAKLRLLLSDSMRPRQGIQNLSRALRFRNSSL